MRNLFLFITIAIVGFVNAQNTFGLYGTSEGFIGADFSTSLSNSPFYGSLKVSGTVTKGTGVDYSNTLGPNSFPEDIYMIEDAPSVIVAVGVGVQSDKFKIGSYFGPTFGTTYYNAYDPYQILSPTGFYFTTEEGSTGWTAGVEMAFIANDKLTLQVGYDPVQGSIFGVGISL